MSRRDELVEVDIFADRKIAATTPPSKKHKRHKKHKRKATATVSKPSAAEYESDAVDVVNDVTDLQPIPHESIVVEQYETVEMSPNDKPKPQEILIQQSALATSSATTPLSKSQKRKKPRNKESGTSSEEERWLDAIESGKLDQVEHVEMKKPKDPKLMTARQRAMYERGTEKEPIPGSEILMALPSGYKEKVMTAEAIQKAAIKSQKRKQLADEKREKEKKRTMERLLKKQDSRIAKTNRNRPIKAAEPVISYRSTASGTTITFPANVELPFWCGVIESWSERTMSDTPPLTKDCAMCGAAKRYNCSRTNIPLCSFKCYKLNVASLKQIMC